MPALLYGLFAYAVFFVTFLYSIGFVGGFVVPKTIDSGAAGSPATSLAIDALLLAVFAVQHSVMARPAFKRVWTRVVPKSIERSTYVLFSSAALVLLYWQWRPLPSIVWRTEGTGRAMLLALYGLGWLIVLLSTFMLSHFELFGLRQVWLAFRARSDGSPTHLERAWLYRFVRHPIMSGFLVAFWATPTMTEGHLLFSVATTAYILLGVRLEERDLVAVHGEAYRAYRREVPMLVPLPKRGERAAAEPARARDLPAAHGGETLPRLR